MMLRFTKGIPTELSSLIAAGEETAFLFADVKSYRKKLNPIRQQAMI